MAELAPRRAHVPPERVVDFDLYAPPGVERDFHRAWAGLLAPHLPALVWTPHNEGHWIATRASLVRAVLSDHRRFSSRTIIIPKSHGDAHGLLPTTVDPPDHGRYRLALNEGLSAAAVRAREDEIRAIARELVAGLADRGRCNFTTDYAEVLPIRIFLGLMDLPLADAPRLKSWADALIRPGGDLSFAAAMERLFAYLAPHVDARRGRGGEDLLSRLLDTSPEGRPLDREECLKLAVQVLIAGLDTVVNFLGFVFLHLARDAALRCELAADPARIPAAVEEFLRRYPLVTIGREVREDLEIDGVLLRAGEMVATPTPLAALDDTFNPRPAEFDPHRGARRSLTFGAGHHVCPGRFLTRAEVRITLEEWLRRIPDFWLPEGAEIRFRGGIVGVVEQLPLEWAHSLARARRPGARRPPAGPRR